MTVGHYIWGIAGILGALLVIEWVAVVEARVVYESFVREQHATAAQYARSHARLEQYFASVEETKRHEDAIRVRFVDFAGLTAPSEPFQELSSEKSDVLKEEGAISDRDQVADVNDSYEVDVGEVQDSAGAEIDGAASHHNTGRALAVSVAERELISASDAKPHPEEQTGADAENEIIAQSEPLLVSPKSDDLSPQFEPELGRAPENEGNQKPDEVSVASYEAAVSEAIHELTNRERAKRGIDPLAYDEALSSIAQGHSADMAIYDYVSHDAPDGCDMTCRFEEAGYVANTWGENIAWRRSNSLPGAKELAADFVESWMESGGHRKNMLNDTFTHQGVGIARMGDMVYATVNFATPK